MIVIMRAVQFVLFFFTLLGLSGMLHHRSVQIVVLANPADDGRSTLQTASFRKERCSQTVHAFSSRDLIGLQMNITIFKEPNQINVTLPRKTNKKKTLTSCRIPICVHLSAYDPYESKSTHQTLCQRHYKKPTLSDKTNEQAHLRTVDTDRYSCLIQN